MSAQDTVFFKKADDIFNPSTKTLVMGILNITPDSFYDGGKYLLEKDWLIYIKQMIVEGVDIIDIGAYSTRPGADFISEKEEEQRLIPVIISIRKHFPEAIISVDTFRASIAEKAVHAGANIINDISGGKFDDKMFDIIVQLNVPYILMHINGTLQTMHEKNISNNITDEVFQFFQTQTNKLKSKGFNKIIIDPGFGFGKTLEQNYQLIADLNKLTALPYPILAGISRKSMITKLLNIKTEDSLNATSALHALCINKGAKILRVHDVKEAKEVVSLMETIKNMP